MKCLCGFKQRPDNIVIFKHHVEDCLTTGSLKDLYPEPFVVWRNNEFTVAKELGEGEVAMEIGVEIKRTEGARVRLEKKISDREATLQAVVQNLENPEEIIEVLDNLKSEEEPVVEEKKKPAAKKPAASKKKGSGSKKL